MSISVFIAAVVGTCIGSSCFTTFICCLILMVFKWRGGTKSINTNGGSTQTSHCQPVYEEIDARNEKMNIHFNDAYSQEVN